jgi:membrane fusion protein (multidrug efflux system)
MTGISLVLLLFIFLWMRSRLAIEPIPEIRPTAVSTVTPVQSDLREELIVSAILESESTIAVVPKVAGTILEILVEEGDPVSEGDVLARIDPEPYLLELRAAESAWFLAESSFSRIESMFGNSGASQQQLDETRAGRDAALSTYELAKMRYGYSDVKSPISGRVLKRYSDSGNLASSEMSLFLIADVTKSRVKVHIPEKYWDRFNNKESIRALVSFPDGGDGMTIEAGVARVSPSISPQSKTFEVTFSVPSGELSWPIGGSMEVDIILRERNDSWSLPLRSLSGENGIWLVDSESLAVSRVSVPDLFRDGEKFAVPEEWADDTFVLDGHHRLTEGQIVQPFDGGT